MTVKLSIRFGEENRVLHLRGREAWAMRKLVEAGETGCTPFNAPGPRWSHYVHRLRGYGLPVETIHEPHGGPFPGHHARYVLRINVEVIEQGEAA
ncbi:hypothetical protein G6M70_09480 [Agrobacterium tumefaciens]|jgi:hypothetical protein|uniref:winged helix domain-containing protein n=1 Tax=Rhizobium/Agrobacterium group TaxID=227290 RepID=UPI000BCB4AFA|nr:MULTISPECIES: hypothetical protein [Rhizobium/Agrobacterium group]NSZ00516.1 hypothetical protein [Agrobacterium tumefaciens]NSZ40197.1 hypothetical protein [Agrobacterium tumefaciens]NTB22792.1 hypothetical protein [Agrobacterium tumefaciens]NTB29302.1 hypothetical protein [Agrobacterium tumefaciens]NTB33202.1 hypothetical protein [Agrobacterium tumefaciens]